MTKKIKPIKCPQCGSEKYDEIGEEKFRCRNCGTEFFLDNDDININVNHHYNFDSGQADNYNPFGAERKKFIAIAVVLSFLFLFVIVKQLFFSSSNSYGYLGSKADSITVDENYEQYALLSHKNKAYIVYFSHRNYLSYKYEDDPKYVNGYYIGLRDVKTGEVVNEKFLVSNENADKQGYRENKTDLQYFYQAKKFYLIVGGHYVYSIDPANLEIKNITKSMFEGKKVLESGFSKIDFIDKDNGEGFLVNDTKAVPYYYFPATNRLYDDAAFSYACMLPPSELNGEMRDSTTYFLKLYKSNANSNEDGLLQLWHLSFVFHNGDPQKLDDYLYRTRIYPENMGYRSLSFGPSTDKIEGFYGALPFADNQYILLSFSPNVTANSNTIFQLRSTRGGVLWTKAVPASVIRNECAVRSGNKIWVMCRTDASNGYHKTLYGFDIKTGQVERGKDVIDRYSFKPE